MEKDNAKMSTEKEKLEKTKINTQVKHVPKDAQVIMSILKDLGIQEYEPRVINQLLEFTYRKFFQFRYSKQKKLIIFVKRLCDLYTRRCQGFR